MLTTRGNYCREEPIVTPWWIYVTDFNLCFSLLLLLWHYYLVTNSCPTLCDPMDSSTPQSSTVSQSLLELVFIESVVPSNHLILLPPSPALNFPSVRVFSNNLAFLP